MVFRGVRTSLVFLLAITCLIEARFAFQVQVGIDHDLSGPTYGLEGKSSSSIKYDNHNGLNLGGTVADLLGPPIKIASGFHNIIKGNNIASVGTGLKAGGALLGFDAKLLETAGAGNLFKGGLLLGGAKAKAALAGKVAGPKGQKIASIIEIPVKVVAVKDLVAGKALMGAGAAKAAGAAVVGGKGAELMQQGHALKSAGLSQIIQGANEGVHNIGSMVQKTADNVNTAFKLLPLIWEQQQQDGIKQVEEAAAAAKGQQQHEQLSKGHARQQQQQGLSGGSLLGGLTSLIPGLSSSALSGNTGPGAGPNPTYAALWNTASPLTNLLSNPGFSPFLMPLAQGPLGQAIVGKAPIGTEISSGAFGGLGGLGGGFGDNTKSGVGQTQSYDFNLLPGIKYHETVSAQMPTFGFGKSSFGPSQSGKFSGKTSAEQVVQEQQLVQEPVKQQHQIIQEPMKQQQQMIQEQVKQQQQQVQQAAAKEQLNKARALML